MAPFSASLSVVMLPPKLLAVISTGQPQSVVRAVYVMAYRHLGIAVKWEIGERN